MMIRTPLSSGRRSRSGFPSDWLTPLPRASPDYKIIPSQTQRSAPAELDGGLGADVCEQRQLEPHLCGICSMPCICGAHLPRGTQRRVRVGVAHYCVQSLMYAA